MKISDYPISDELRGMIERVEWVPGESGWRPFETKEEAEIIIEETLCVRGCNFLAKCESLSDLGGEFTHWLSYNRDYTYQKFLTFEQLFESYKVSGCFHPVGLPL